MDARGIQELTVQYIELTTSNFQKIPGSAILSRYVQSSYQNDPVRSAIELFLILFAVRYLFSSSYSTKQNNDVILSKEEIDDLVEEWTPEELVVAQTALERTVSEKQPVIIGPTGPKCKLSNGRTVTNLASYNFYNFATDDLVKQNAIQTLRKYGVGPCSAPQFYGTQDVHMHTEAQIASFIGTEACVLYAHSFSAITSVIPSFAKRGDVIVADEAVNCAIRKGLQICRSKIYYYKHNDLEDLERILQKIVRESKVLTRRFIVTEGLFETIGDTIDLQKIISLKNEYKFRLMLDESWSFGVLGRHGRGVTQSQSVDPSQVDIIVGSLSGPLSAAGGFCASSYDIAHHQRITSGAYTFSCALPAMLATTAVTTIAMLQENPGILTGCRENIKKLRAQLARSGVVDATSAEENPIQLLVLKASVIKSHALSREHQELILQDCVDELLARNILITNLKPIPVIQNSSPQEQGWKPPPALKICVSAALERKEIERIGAAIVQVVFKAIEGR